LNSKIENIISEEIKKRKEILNMTVNIGEYCCNIFEYACTKGNETIANFLIENGTDINKENKYGNTPLSLACKKEKRLLLNF